MLEGEPMDSRVQRKFLLWAAEKKLKKGSRLNGRIFLQTFYLKLDPPEQDAIHKVLRSLMEKGVLNFEPPWTNYPGENGWIQNIAQFFITMAGEKAIYEEKYRSEAPREMHRSIGAINIGAGSHVQVGDGNSMRVENFFKELERMVEQSDGSDEEKTEAKSLLIKMSENPLISTLLSSVGGAAMKHLLGLS